MQDETANRQVGVMASAMGSKIRKAYALAGKVHKNQKRKTGKPYITHPVAVAKMVFDIGVDRDTVVAAILHDTLEDAKQRDVASVEEQIHREFGDHVLYMVQAVSKDCTISNKLEQQEKYIEQIEKAFEIDIGVFFIKIGDLLHNLETVFALSPEKKEQWMHELKYQYLPLFSEYFHTVPMHYKSAFHKLVSKVQKTIDLYEEKSKK